MTLFKKGFCHFICVSLQEGLASAISRNWIVGRNTKHILYENKFLYLLFFLQVKYEEHFRNNNVSEHVFAEYIWFFVRATDNFPTDTCKLPDYQFEKKPMRKYLY